MEQLIGIVKEVQNVLVACSSSEIKLPQIVVVGSQSAGKSSVLEQIVGESFLPRGTGIVTRCPLEIQLVRTPDGTKEYTTFHHDDTKRYTDYDLIKEEIKAQILKLAGAGKKISNTPIKLKIYSPSLLDLTLVDLPGLIHIPVDDQPANIEDQTKALILKYIKNSNSIILAVTAANTDMAASDSLKIAKEVDPQGDRTLAVLTKLDLMDQGTDAPVMLLGKVIPVKLGVIGVVNRSQQGINDDKTIQENVKKEAEFLKKNYERIAAFHGSQYLVRKVQSIYIQNCMHELKKSISESLKSKQNELLRYRKSSLDSYKMLRDLILKFTQIFISSIEGTFSVCLSMVQTYGLSWGSGVNVLKKSFSQDLKNIDPLDGLDEATILNTIHHSFEINNEAIYLPMTPFVLLAKRQVEQFQNPSLRCLRLTYEKLCQTLERCLQDESLLLERYPKLKTIIRDVVTDLIKKCLQKTNESIENLMKIQTSHINTSHPGFLEQKSQSIKKLYSEKYDDNCSETVNSKDKDSVHYALMKECLESYMSIMSNTFEDQVPRIVICDLVIFVADKLHCELLEKIVDKENHADLMLESADTTKKRSEIEAEILELEKAEANVKTISVKSNKVMKF